LRNNPWNITLNIVKTHGKTPVTAKTSNSTSKSKAKSSQSVTTVGAKSPNKTMNGEQNMENFSLNSAKSYIGKNVNLHLKDGAVIVNVQLTAIKKAELGKANLLEYIPFGNLRTKNIPLRSVAYAEMLNRNLMLVRS
jgi:hypothetical protein